MSKFLTSWFQHFGHQSFLQGDIIITDGHDQAWSGILKVLKVTSLQYLYNILKKKLEMKFIFHM